MGDALVDRSAQIEFFAPPLRPQPPGQPGAHLLRQLRHQLMRLGEIFGPREMSEIRLRQQFRARGAFAFALAGRAVFTFTARDILSLGVVAALKFDRSDLSPDGAFCGAPKTRVADLLARQ